MAEEFEFFPITIKEFQLGGSGCKPRHIDFFCGPCGKSTNGRIVTQAKRESDGAFIMMCVCSCPNAEPAILLEKGGKVIAQVPEAREFHAGENWPPDLAQLFEEAAKAFAAGAYTAAVMACRKVLMACACHEGDRDGKPFADYVSYITSKVLSFPKAKDAIDKIRTIGNDANHQLKFVGRDDARRAMMILNYMLNTIYSLPSA